MGTYALDPRNFAGLDSFQRGRGAPSLIRRAEEIEDLPLGEIGSGGGGGGCGGGGVGGTRQRRARPSVG